MDISFIDNELEFELKELQTITKNWHSNLAFVAEEVQDMKEALLRSMGTDLEDDQLELAQMMNLKINRITFDISKVQGRLPNQLKMLEYLVSGGGTHLSLDLIENHAQLEKRVAYIFTLFMEVKAEMHQILEPVELA